MTDDATACSCCEGLVVMVAVACSQCGELHRSGYASAHRAGAATSSWSNRRPVWDVPAPLPGGPTGADSMTPLAPVPVPRSGVLQGSAPPRMRTSVIYANAGRRSHAAPQALSPGRPAPRPAPSPSEAPPDPPRQWREPGPPRRPVVEIIQEVINRSAAGDLQPGTRVVVRNRFNGRWTPGFSVHEALDGGYRIRREHNGAVLPAVFFRSDVAVHESTPRVGAAASNRAAARASL